MKISKKLNKKSLFFIFFILLGILIIFIGIERLGDSAQKGEIKISEENPTLNTYTNIEYGFEIDFPSHWQINEEFGDKEKISPVVNIYLPNNNVAPPFDHFANINNVSIFPQGLQTEAVIGQFKQSEIEMEVPFDVARDYVLEDGTIWGTYINVQLDEPWKPWGFIWAKNVINDFEYKCLSNGIEVDSDFCNPFEGDEFVRSGNIDSEIRKEIEEIINSFRLIDES
jgi:hypothetical protein